MTNLIMEGFNTYVAVETAGATALAGTQWTIVGSGTDNNIIVTEKAGLQCVGVRSNASASSVQRSIPDNDVIAFGARVYKDESYTNGDNVRGISLRSSLAANSLRIGIDSLGRPTVWRDTTILYQSAVSVPFGAWHYLDAVYDRGAGTLEFYFNGTLLTTVTGIAAIPAPLSARVGSVSSNFQVSWTYYTDVVFNAGVRWGDVSIRRVPPVADIFNDWTTVGAASAYEALENVPSDGTQYIESLTVGDIAQVETEALPAGVFQVFAVKHQYRAFKTTSGAGSITPGLIVGGVEYPSTENNLSQTTPVNYETIYSLNPATGVPWIVSDFAPGNIGLQYERTQ